MADANLTERQRKWFNSVRQGLERDTGRTISEWVTIARSCPETGHRARLRWFKETHGLLQNRASYVLSEAFESQMPWNEADALVDALWTDPGARAIYEAVDAAALSLDGAIRTARKGYTAWSRRVQFAAAKPVKGGVSSGWPRQWTPTRASSPGEASRGRSASAPALRCGILRRSTPL